jgi:hypothetical protein
MVQGRFFDLLRIMVMGRNWFFHYLRIVRHGPYAGSILSFEQNA